VTFTLIWYKICHWPRGCAGTEFIISYRCFLAVSVVM